MADEKRTLDVICVDDLTLFRQVKPNFDLLLELIARHIMHDDPQRSEYPSPFGIAYGDNFRVYSPRLEGNSLVIDSVVGQPIMLGNLSNRLDRMYSMMKDNMRRKGEENANPVLVMLEDDYHGLTEGDNPVWRSYREISTRRIGVNLNLIATYRKDKLVPPTSGAEPVSAAQGQVPNPHY